MTRSHDSVESKKLKEMKALLEKKKEKHLKQKNTILENSTSLMKEQQELNKIIKVVLGERQELEQFLKALVGKENN